MQLGVVCEAWVVVVNRYGGNMELIAVISNASMATRWERQPVLSAYREDCKVVTAPSDEHWQSGGLESFMLRPKRARPLRIFTELPSPK